MMPDESKVKSAQTGAEFLQEAARAEIAAGYTLRVSPMADLAAFPHIEEACRKYAREFAQRMVSQALLGGAQLVAKELEAIVSRGAVPEAKGSPAQPDELAL